MLNSIVVFLATLLITQSQVCTGASFFNGQRCAPCLTNCQCSQENTCSSCLSGYTYDALFQNCLQCPLAVDLVNVGCSQCCYQVQGPAFVCSSCPSGPYTFLQGGQCIKVMGCTSLSSEGVCLNCATGYYLNQGACSACDVSCATCYASSLCLTCSVGYYNATNVNNALCQTCSTGCITCSSSSTCTACSSGFRLNAAACTACSANCNSCTAAACTTCNSLSVLIGTNCHLCTDTSKQGSAGCTTCTASANRVLCSACSSGYYLDPTTSTCYTCSSKFPNPVLCTYSVPLQCSNDAAVTINTRYYLVNNQCVANTNNCKDMLDSTGKCSSCYFTAATGYYSLINGVCSLCNVSGCSTYSSTCQCLSCQNGYQFINNQCVACQSLHCHVCQASVTACQQCAPAYGRLSSACQLCQPSNCYNCDGDNTVCASCNTGYYLSGGNCYQCQSNCATCISNTQCTSCIAGTYLQANGRCKTLPNNCISIDTATLKSNVGSCKRCAFGYILL